MTRAAIALCLLAAPVPAFAQAGDPAVQQIGPPGFERELSTDRPDKTESPFTVPGGRFQIETDVAAYTRDRSSGVLTETLALATTNLKLGIGDDTDLQLIVEPYLRRTDADGRSGARRTVDGIGDVTVRLKHNLWGNDGGRTALAVMPFLKLPTNSGDLGAGRAEFGVIVPLAISLSDRVNLGLMTEIDLIEESDGRGYRASFINSATLGLALTERLGLYAELFTERGDAWVVTGDVGLTYAVGDNTQLDVGANVGVTRAADDLTVFMGISRRF